MRRSTQTALMLSFAAALMLTGTGIGKADGNLAVCAQTYGKGEGISCDFTNYEQCRAYVSGLAGSCVDNPYRSSSKQIPARRVRR